MRFGIIASWWACGALVGCSPYVYSGDISAYSGSVTAVEAAYQGNADRITAEQRLLERIAWTRTRPVITLGSGCNPGGRPDGAPCVLVAKGSEAPSRIATRLAPPPPPKKQPVDVCQVGQDAQSPPAMPAPTESTVATLAPVTRAEVFRALDRYAAGLAAVTNAKDREQFDAAAAKVSVAVGSLAGTAGAAAGVGVVAAPATKTATNLALWLVGQGLDYRRLQELRNATRKACEPVHALAIAVEFILSEQRGNRLDVLNGLLAEKVRAANPVPGHPRLTDQAYVLAMDDAQATASVFQTVREIDPARLAAALSEGHDALVLAVRNNDGQFDALVRSLQDFNDQVRNLVAAGNAAGVPVKN
jgi:hypothetical protein